MSGRNMLMMKLIAPDERDDMENIKNASIYLHSMSRGFKKQHGTHVKQHEKQPKKLPRSKIKQMGLYAIPHGTIMYKDALSLHNLWCGYMKSYLSEEQIPHPTNPRYSTLVEHILKSDFHGAKICIIRSKQSSVVGMKGIVILDTKGTFKIVSKDNKIRTIPKNDSQFEVIVGDVVISVFGKFLNARPAERSSRKMKVFPLPDL